MLLEHRVYGLWIGKQTAKGTPNDTPSRRLIQVGGDVGLNVDTGSENWSDLSKFGSLTQWVNSVLGQGAPAIESTPTELAYLLWLFHGSETASNVNVTGTADTTIGSPNLTNVNPTTGWVNGAPITGAGIPAGTTILSGAGTTTMVMSANATATAVGVAITSTVAVRHAFTPNVGGGHWATIARRIGQSIIRRDQHADSRIGQVVIEGSTATKVLRITPTILSLDPGIVRAADPTPAIPEDAPLLYTDGAGAYKLNIAGGGDVIFRGQSQFTITLNEDLSPAFGDDVRPHDLSQGNAQATIGATLLLDADANARWNEQVYGAAAPAAGTKPLARVSPLGGYSCDLNQRDQAGRINGRGFDFDSDAVQWQIPDYPGPNPDGGATEIAMAGTIRTPPGGGSAYTMGVETSPTEAAFTA